MQPGSRCTASPPRREVNAAVIVTKTESRLTGPRQTHVWFVCTIEPVSVGGPFHDRRRPQAGSRQVQHDMRRGDLGGSQEERQREKEGCRAAEHAFPGSARRAAEASLVSGRAHVFDQMNRSPA